MAALPDHDSQETREWLDALDSVLEHEGPERAHFLLEKLIEKARRSGAYLPYSANTTRPNRSFLNLCLAILVVQAIVGGIGFALHLRGIFGGVANDVRENILFGPPVFAPLLFINLAILSGLGIFDLKSRCAV